MPPVKQPRWTEYVDVTELIPDERNPKGHADAVLDESLERFGYTEQVMVDERTGKLVAGHGRRKLVLRARDKGGDPPDGIVLDGDRWLIPVQRGWSSKDDEEALGYLVASNRLVELGGWQASLAATVEQLAATSSGLEGIGYTQADLDQLLADAQDDDDDDEARLLAAADVTFGEPTHTVAHGETWAVGNRHVLVCADLITEHWLWRNRLKDDVFFCPYPGPFVALGRNANAKEVRLLLVQPDPYIAGHILDKWCVIHGEASVKRLSAK